MAAEKPVLALTMGDPGGVGPETVLKLLGRGAEALEARILVVGDREYLLGVAGALGLPEPPPEAESAEEFRGSEGAAAVVCVGSLGREPRFGGPDAELGAASLAYVDRAVELARDGTADGIVTAPVSKAAVSASHPGFSGHTEYLAEALGAGRVVMMLAGGGLRVGIVTTHVSLKEMLGMLTSEAIREAAVVMDLELRRRFGVKRPRIAVAGVNPHASEAGLFGDEEQRVIAPAIERLRDAGIDASGPEVADVVFHRQLAGEFDAVLAMYHDQACIAVKTLAFDEGVNVTLGLPVVRTSPDHGTAFGIAGRGVAKESSLAAAVGTAALMCREETGGGEEADGSRDEARP